MADRRDDERRFRGERRDPETERRIDRLADRYRGSDERGYGGGERLGRDWERGDVRGAGRSGRGERLRSADEERFSRGRDVRGSQELPRERGERKLRDRDSRGGREEWRASPSGAFHEERGDERDRPWRYGDRTRHTSLPYETGRWGTGDLPEHEERGHYNLAGLHDLDDMSELRERFREHRRQRDYEPRYGHGPGIENMEPPRLGYGTSTTRRDDEDHELGHRGMLGGTYRAGAPLPMGRGPKSYQRSDDRIREDICDRLMMSWMDAERVDVLVRDGEVTLQGFVRTRDEKRAIEALSESVLGVKDVHNALRVDRGEQLQERRAQDQEQTSVQKPGDTPLHS
jgi:hypothetical protein